MNLVNDKKQKQDILFGLMVQAGKKLLSYQHLQAFTCRNSGCSLAFLRPDFRLYDNTYHLTS